MKFKEYILRLRPYKRKYRIFCMTSFIVLAFAFMMIMFIFSYIVPHINGGFYYFFNGFNSLVRGYGGETNACLGFVMAGFLLAYIPIIFLIPILYFTIANWFIFEKLGPSKFANLNSAKYHQWALIIHFAEIAVLTLIITGIIELAGGFNPFIFLSSAMSMTLAFSDGAVRFIGIAGILHFFVGYLFALIDICWLFWLLLKWIGKQIGRFFDYIGKLIEEAKKRRLERKIERKNQKIKKQ